MYSEISVNELKQLIPRVRIIDIRDNYQFNISSIPTSINIPMQFLLKNPDVYMDKNNTYYIYCEYGKSSSTVCSKLSTQGYNVINVSGGFSKYKLI